MDRRTRKLRVSLTTRISVCVIAGFGAGGGGEGGHDISISEEPEMMKGCVV